MTKFVVSEDFPLKRKMHLLFRELRTFHITFMVHFIFTSSCRVFFHAYIHTNIPSIKLFFSDSDVLWFALAFLSCDNDETH